MHQNAPPTDAPGKNTPGGFAVVGCPLSGVGIGNSTANTLHRNPSTLPPCRGCPPVSGSGALFGCFGTVHPAPVAGGVPAPGNPSPGAVCLSGTLPGKNKRCSRCRVPRPGFLPRPGCFCSVSYAPCPRPPVVSVPGLGGAPPGRFPGTLPGCEPGGCPSCQTVPEGRNPGNPEPVHPAVIVLSAGVAYRQTGKEPAPGHGFRFPRYRGNLYASPGFPSTRCPLVSGLPRNPFRNGSRGYLYPGGGCFPVWLSMFAGVPVTLRLIRVPRPGLPRGRFRFPSGEWNRGNPPRRMEPGHRGLPPGNSSIHRGQPRFFGGIVTLPLTTPLYVPPSSPFWRVLLRCQNVSAFNCKSVTKTTFKTTESPKIHDF